MHFRAKTGSKMLFKHSNIPCVKNKMLQEGRNSLTAPAHTELWSYEGMTVFRHKLFYAKGCGCESDAADRVDTNRYCTNKR